MIDAEAPDNDHKTNLYPTPITSQADLAAASDRIAEPYQNEEREKLDFSKAL